MKKLYFILILSLLIPIVSASNLTPRDTYERDNSLLSTLLEKDNFYLFIDDNILNKYDESGNLIASKTLEGLKNLSIIPYETNYLVVGKENSFLKIFLLNEYLQVIGSKETTIPVSHTSLYNYDNKIYLLLHTNYILDDINLYEIDKDLVVKENTLSSYGSDTLKAILKSDYEAIKNEDFNKIILDTAYNTQSTILLSKKEDKYYLTIINDKEKEIEVEESKEIIVLNNKILLLTKNSIQLYSLEGTKEETIFLDEEYNHMIKTSNKIILINNTKIKNYTFTIDIQVEESNLGTIEIENTSNPNEKIKYKVTPNSGYELEELIITDEYGNNIKTKDEYFIAPSSNAKVLAVYKETVNNPNTVDKIVIFILVAFLASTLVIYNYKKIKWINH